MQKLSDSSGAAVALVGWTALVVWLTWPLAKAIDRAVPLLSGPDALYSMWALAWQCHALATDPGRLLDANIYHPTPRALLYGPTGMGALPLFAPAYAASGSPIVAANVLVIGGTALTAWTLGLVATRWTHSAAAGAVAGATYLGTRWVFTDWVPACPHFAMLLWFPLIIDRASRPLFRARDALVLAALIALQGAVEVVYLAPAVLGPLALLAALRLCRSRTRRSGVYLCVALAAGTLALAPLVIAHAAVREANPNLAVQTPWPSAGEPAPASFPWGLFGWDTGLAPPPPLAVPGLAFAVITFGLASLGFRRNGVDRIAAHGWRHAALWTLSGIVLGMPSRALIFGTIVALPHGWLGEVLPAIRVIRVPARLGVAGLMGLCLLTGLAFHEIVRRLLGRWAVHRGVHLAWGAAAAAMVLALVGYRASTRPYRLHPTPQSAPYAATLGEGREPLLEIGYDPARRFPDQISAEARATFRSIGHWWPLLNGYGSYWPEQYMERQLLAARLPEDFGALRTLRRETGVEWILAWPNNLPPAKRAAWNAVAARHDHPLLALVASGEQGALLFRVKERAGP